MKARILTVVAVAALLVASMPLAADAGSRGQCNAIVARALGTMNEVDRGIDVASNCLLLAAAQLNFIDAGCAPLLDNGELFINKIVVNGVSCNLVGVLCDVIATCGILNPPLCDDAPSCS